MKTIFNLCTIYAQKTCAEMGKKMKTKIKGIFTSLVENFKYVIKMFQLMYENDKAYIFFLVADVIIYACIPFTNILLVKLSISMLEEHAEFGTFLPVVLAMLALGVFLNLLHNYLNYKRDVHGSTISVALYKNVFTKTLNSDYEQLLDKKFSEKRELAIGIINGSHFAALTNAFHNIVSNILILVGVTILLSKVDFRILIAVGVVVLINTVSVIYRKKYERGVHVDITPTLRKIRYFMDIGADVSYVKEIKTYQMDRKLIERYVDLEKNMYAKVDKTRKISLCSYGIAHVMGAVLNGIVYSYLGFRVLVRNNLSLSDFSLFLSAIISFNGSVQTIISSFVDIGSNGRYLQDYFTFMDLPSCDIRKSGETESSICLKELFFEFKNVSYRYPNKEEYALRNLNLTIKGGEKVAIVGENGAGKTTLVMLLLRMIKPTEGKILLNGVDIEDYDIDVYQRIFAGVYQDYRLFAFTFAENVTALVDTNEDKVWRVLEKVGLKKKIVEMKKGIDTYIDKLYEEDGVRVSGGESQRLAIARALYKDALVFILDEPTSSLDPKMENEIFEMFDEITSGKTAFYITHRLGSVHLCNRVIVLDHGNVVEDGSHSELIHHNGLYADLFRTQARLYVEEESLSGQE